MAEDILPISSSELEGLLIETCNCVSIGKDQINVNQYDFYIDKIRPFFVSTLEDKIYALLEKFVYSEDADRIHEQFPCLKKCIKTATTLSGPVKQHYTKYIGTGVVEGAIKGTIKHLIKEGFFTAFINSVVLNNRINRICRELDALGIEKTRLGYLNVWNFVCEKDYWIVNPFQAQIDDPLSDLVVEVDTEDQECIPCKVLKRRASDDPNDENDSEICGNSAYKIRRTNSNQEYSTSSTSCCRKKLGAKYLRISVSKVQFASCGCVDVVRPRKFGKLKLPCKSEDVIRKIFKVDKILPHSCLTRIKKKFEEAVYNVCSCLNDVLSRVDSKIIKNLYLACEIRSDYVNFKLKSMLGPSCKPYLFSVRVTTCRSVSKGQSSLRKSFSREDEKSVKRAELSLTEFCKATYSHESPLSDVQEKEEEIIETDFLDIPDVSSEVDNLHRANVSCGPDVSCEPDPEDISCKLDPDPETVLYSKTALEVNKDSNDFKASKYCSCGQVLNISRSSFFEIEMKLRDISESFKKPSSKTQEESVLCKTEKMEELDYQQRNELENLQENLQEPEEPDLKKLNDITCCPVLPEFDESSETFPDSKEADSTSECIYITKIDPNLKRNETIESNISSDCNRISRKFSKAEKSQIPRPICSRKNYPLFPNIEESKQVLEEERDKKITSTLFPCLGKECSPAKRKCETLSRIPVLVKEKSSVISSCQQPSPPSSLCRNRSIPTSNEKLKSRLLSSRKRAATSSRQRCSKVSRCNLPKFDHKEDVKDSNKTCFNLTIIKSNLSVATPTNVPNLAKRNIIACPRPSSRSCSPQKYQQTNLEFPKMRQSVCSRTFIKNKPESSLMNVCKMNSEKVPQKTYVIVTDSEEINDQCDSKCPCDREFDILEKVPSTCSRQSSEIIKDSKTRKSFDCIHDSSLDRMIQKLEVSPFKDAKGCLLKSQIKEIVKPIGIERRNRFYNQNLRTVSVQTLEQKMSSKGINIDIKETKETLSKGINVDRRETETKGVNIDLISKDSFISLQTNVTKIISVVDITIFEGDLEKRKCKKPLEDIPKEDVQPRTTCSKPNACQLSIIPNTSPKCCVSKEKNPKFHLRSSIYPKTSDFLPRQTYKRISKIKVKPCGAKRPKRMGGIGDSWLCPNRTTKAQNIINAICDPFSHKSINRIKYLIRTKLCKMLLDRERSGSKSFVSNERYYVSASSEKTCCSPGRKIFSSESSRTEDSDFCSRRIGRMTGVSDNRVFKCPIKIGSGWEFDGGDEDCFLIRKRCRSSKERYLRTPKEEELRTSLKKDRCTSKEEVRTLNGRVLKINTNQSPDWDVGYLDRSECPKQLESNESGQIRSIKRRDDRNRTKDRSNTSPGEVITFCHLGKRNDKVLRQRGNWSCRENDKENGCIDLKRSSQGRSNSRIERGRFSLRAMSRAQGKNRLSFGREEIDESFCDLDQNVRSKLREYVNLCKSAKYFLLKGPDDVYGVSSTSIPFSDGRELR